MIVLIDNYDSFSYNLFQMIGVLEPDIKVVRNDEYTAQELFALKPSALILSPGPGKPKDAGICEETVRQCAGTVPVLGICLGHQAICEAFGAEISHAKTLMHGKQSVVQIDSACPLFEGLERKISVGRYHSLSVSSETVPECLKVSSLADDGEIMAVAHRDFLVFGLQFHPESILTPLGGRILNNFLALVNR